MPLDVPVFSAFAFSDLSKDISNVIVSLGGKEELLFLDVLLIAISVDIRRPWQVSENSKVPSYG